MTIYGERVAADRNKAMTDRLRDLRARADKLTKAGVKMIVPPYEADSVAYGEKGGGKVLTCLFEDPDGTILQFDQRAH